MPGPIIHFLLQIFIILSYRIAFGCSTRIRLPAEDPDGDRVRCRWAHSSECGQACSNMPPNAVKLNKVRIYLLIRCSAAYCPRNTISIKKELNKGPSWKGHNPRHQEEYENH